MLLMSYFTAASESLHLAVSVDGRTFLALNGGEPLMTSAVGTGRLRDPFVGLGSDGRYHLLGTNGWASTSVVHAVSEDLRSWRHQELLPLMAGVPGAHNAWAPEFFLDETGAARLIWSSCVDDDASARDWEYEPQDHRIWHSLTRDFRTFSPPGIFFDPGHSVIDATVVEHQRRYHLAYKDERGDNALDSPYKRIMVASAVASAGPYKGGSDPVSPAGSEGPTMFRAGNEWLMLFDRFLEGGYGAASSPDLLTWSPVDVVVPSGARHASVTRLTAVPDWIYHDPAMAAVASAPRTSEPAGSVNTIPVNTTPSPRTAPPSAHDKENSNVAE